MGAECEFVGAAAGLDHATGGERETAGVDAGMPDDLRGAGRALSPGDGDRTTEWIETEALAVAAMATDGGVARGATTSKFAVAGASSGRADIDASAGKIAVTSRRVGTAIGVVGSATALAVASGPARARDVAGAGARGRA